MSKVTSKLQVTVPKAIAEQYDIEPGDEIDWVAAGEVIRVVPPSERVSSADPEARLRLFDRATERQRRRDIRQKRKPRRARGWRREDLYERGRPR
jgi:AbrB family looped-hinge helix DNA binding protein